MILSDDIGSFPLPCGISRDEISSIAKNSLISEEDKQYEKFCDIVQDAMLKKIFANVDTPTYPQFRDMISSFYDLIIQFQSDEPFVIKNEYAVIPEVSVLINDKFKEKLENFGIECVNLRVCITGPVELYINRIGFHIDSEILYNIARSVEKFVKNAIISKKFIKTTVIAIDEPSIGLNPNVIACDDDLINGWNIAIETAKKNNIDTEIHLHSPNKIDLVLKSNIDVIDIDVENLKYEYVFQKDELRKYDKFVRVGIAKSNIFEIIESYKKRNNIDLWQTKDYAKIFEIETQEIIGERLDKAYKIYGELIKYAGPACGMGSWPTQDTAAMLLKYCSDVVHSDKFKQ